jgi:transcriptional regulator with XRE-family HTH domain
MREKREKRPQGFPERLRKARTDKDLSQAALAEIVGIHLNQINRYEKGGAVPNSKTLQRLAEALEVSGDYLISGDMEFAARANLEDRELLGMFQSVSLLPASDKDALKRIISALVNQHRIEEMVKK